ncbi:type II 3-dehydroquinate dehydratase [Frondihabitans cladoniiphilus]|uniref:3-dehydroquinate dehydratase n=1 Tax=Frondihabitans cladoniiphilus TaxID=715785 RepID=A0ABP8VR51_9MICO
MTTVLVAAAPERARPGSGRIASSAGGGAPEASSGLRSELMALGGTVHDGDLTVEFRQTDDEAELIHWLGRAVESGWGVVLDPTGFTHYSYALRDAAAAVTEAGLPLIEVHLGNPGARDDGGRSSVISAVSTGVIAGLGFDSYRFAVQAAAARVRAGVAARA